MGKRGRYKKVTTVGRDVFGNKRIETRWVPDGGGCGALAVIGLVLFFLVRGCA